MISPLPKLKSLQQPTFSTHLFSNHFPLLSKNTCESIYSSAGGKRVLSLSLKSNVNTSKILNPIKKTKTASDTNIYIKQPFKEVIFTFWIKFIGYFSPKWYKCIKIKTRLCYIAQIIERGVAQLMERMGKFSVHTTIKKFLDPDIYKQYLYNFFSKQDWFSKPIGLI